MTARRKIEHVNVKAQLLKESPFVSHSELFVAKRVLLFGTTNMISRTPKVCSGSTRISHHHHQPDTF